MSAASPDNETSSAQTSSSARPDTQPKSAEPSLLAKLSHASYIYTLKGILKPIFWLRDWSEYFYPPDSRPNIVKAYDCHPTLPIRIFFPATYDQTSPATLPTLFTIHGGGFCFGHIRDDDEWNRAFADTQDVLVIALNYSKAPGSPFPAALHDLEALVLAILADESLPIDRDRGGRTALLGFSAGANLALAVSQLDSIRTHPHAPAAAVSFYGYLDMSIPPAAKLANRPWKPSLSPPRGDKTDSLMGLAPTFDWSYIPYGQDLRDPLLSPVFADREKLPPFVGIVGAELDMLAFEGWGLACRLAREGSGDAARRVPERDSEDVKWRVCGREEVASGEGLELADERFAFEETWEGGSGGGVKWLLVPDVIHGFDNVHVRELMGGKEAIEDGERKAKLCVAEMGRWLKETVWKV
ncbi:alpha/beta hydrolase fold protein [Cercophora scortea]|uniref:Alpha/beta hydrolase fold protein n=1 Tax=Cercophora scortea TaxID=314031 RepID=A0AAE0I2J3_9PEZI|nr:alpha/beta hydrolase fold protein [Cercophora scortea]